MARADESIIVDILMAIRQEMDGLSKNKKLTNYEKLDRQFELKAHEKVMVRRYAEKIGVIEICGIYKGGTNKNDLKKYADAAAKH